MPIRHLQNPAELDSLGPNEGGVLHNARSVQITADDIVVMAGPHDLLVYDNRFQWDAGALAERGAPFWVGRRNGRTWNAVNLRSARRRSASPPE